MMTVSSQTILAWASQMTHLIAQIAGLSTQNFKLFALNYKNSSRPLILPVNRSDSHLPPWTAPDTKSLSFFLVSPY
jgi:hypothetical protein